MLPIWKDVSYLASCTGFVDFRIEYYDNDTSGSIIYEGRVQGVNGSARFYPNSIIRNYLKQYLVITGYDEENVVGSDAIHKFRILKKTDGAGSWTAVATPQFVLNWTYDDKDTPDFDPDARILTAGGIRRWECYKGVALPVTFRDSYAYADSGSSYVEYEGDEAYAMTALVYNPIYDENVGATVTFSTENAESSVTYKVADRCGARFGLYYVNAYGGWDFFLCKSDVYRFSDAVERETFRKATPRISETVQERTNWRNTMTRTLELHSGNLTDAQAKDMPQLLESPLLLLWDFDNLTSVPVVITASEAEEKTFMNGGKKRVEYTITVEYANERIRQ